MKNIILRYFTAHLKNVLENSQYAAARRKKGRRKVEIMDILKALTLEKGSVGYNLLKNLKVFKIIGENVGTKQCSVPKNARRGPKIPVPFSFESHNLIVGAIRAAQEFQFPYVGTEHLLFAVLECNDKEIINTISADNSELQQLIEKIKRVMSKSFELREDPAVFMDFAEKAKPEIEKNNAEKQKILQDVMGEMSQLLLSLMEKKKRKDAESLSGNFFHPYRPPFGIVTPSVNKTERFIEHFSRDLNKETLAGKIDPVIGRAKEIDDLVTILMRKFKNNPVLVGEPGVGKTAIVAGLARKIVEKDVPPVLLGKRIMVLDLGLLVAGTSFRGEFEDRFKRILDEAENDPAIILFIDEMHNLVGAGSAQGSLDAANIIKPALARGELRCIGATTLDEYQRYIEKDGALERRFQPVWVQEPSRVDTVKIIKGIRRYYEEYHSVKISDLAIKEAIKLSSRYITDRFLPDKAIDLIDESAAYVVRDEHDRGTTKKLHRLVMQKERLGRIKEKMVKNNNLEMAASLKRSEKDLEEIIFDLERKVTEERKFIPVVDERDVAEVLSRKYNLPLELVLESAAQRIRNLPKNIKKQFKGQDEVVTEVTATLKRTLAGIADPERPATAFLFVGPTGVGKTYLAKLIARELFLKEDSVIRVDMSEFNEKHTVSRLLGSPPGYVGYGETNSFTDKIRKNPYSLVLFDEIEKAHPEVFHILLQVLEDGFLTNGTGRKINFRNAIIVFTSNLGNDEFLKGLMGFSEKTRKTVVGTAEKVKIRGVLEDFLRPEFLNRLSNIVFFKPLGVQDLKEIAALEIKKLKTRLLETKKLKLEIDEEILGNFAKKSYDKKEGVRLLRRLMQREVEEPIAKGLLGKRIYKGAKIKFLLRKTEGDKQKGRESDWLKITVLNPKKPALVKSYGKTVLDPARR